MLDIDDHKADPYIKDWWEARDQGETPAIEAANQALMASDFERVMIQAQGDDLDADYAASVCDRVALAASACATAERIGKPEIAKHFAEQAKTEALVLSTYDYAKAG